ncbi:hypothetical protein [Stutzerimonas nitrititolerans]|uniref:hypothetical protein n=1 Tax=Stutzerimonas nitrititolerans TaxID=2482751 RepID=UPI00289DE60B|nr:hypothetical protein [Stutzerimonas nitrititolerans]
MTVAYAVPVTVCDKSTLDICIIYLVGGFDEEKNFYPGRPEFRQNLTETLSMWGYWADQGHAGCRQIFKCIAMYMLTAGNMKYRGRNYSFCVDEFDNKTLELLVEEMLAQVNEW